MIQRNESYKNSHLAQPSLTDRLLRAAAGAMFTIMHESENTSTVTLVSQSKR